MNADWLRNAGTELGGALWDKLTVCAKKGTVLGFMWMLFNLLENNLANIMSQNLPNMVALLCFFVILLVVCYNLLMHDRFAHFKNGSNHIISLCVLTMLIAAVVQQHGPEAAGRLIESLFDGFSRMVCTIIEVSFKSFSAAFWPLGPVLAALLMLVFCFYRSATFLENIRAVPGPVAALQLH
jgi:hypothetical protein